MRHASKLAGDVPAVCDVNSFCFMLCDDSFRFRNPKRLVGRFVRMAGR